MKYLITVEDGQHYLSNEITDDVMLAFDDGLLSIVRIEDCHELIDRDVWSPVNKWGDWE